MAKVFKFNYLKEIFYCEFEIGNYGFLPVRGQRLVGSLTGAVTS